MLKRLSKTGEYTHLMLIALIGLVFYYTQPIIINQPSYAQLSAPIGQWLTESITLNPITGKVILFIATIIIAFYLNRLSAASEIFPRQSYLSSTLLIVLLLFTPPAVELASGIVVMVLLSISLGSMMIFFGKQNPYVQVLNASIAVAISSMVIPHTIIFMFFIWFGFFTYSVNSWREWLISVIGIIIPYLYMLFAYFWNDNIEYILNLYKSFYYSGFFRFTQPSTLQIISLILLLLIYFVTAFKFTNDASDKVISTRKRMWLIFQFSVIAIITITLMSQTAFLLLPILYIPISIMMSYHIHSQRKSLVFDIFIITFVVSILINRIFA